MKIRQFILLWGGLAGVAGLAIGAAVCIPIWQGLVDDADTIVIASVSDVSGTASQSGATQTTETLFKVKAVLRGRWDAAKPLKLVHQVDAQGTNAFPVPKTAGPHNIDVGALRGKTCLLFLRRYDKGRFRPAFSSNVEAMSVYELKPIGIMGFPADQQPD